MQKRIVLGIDAGSAAVSVVAMEDAGRIIATAYDNHKGRVADTIKRLAANLLPEKELARIDGIARTATVPRLSVPGGSCIAVDGNVAEILAIRKFHPQTRTLLIVGAERFARISFDPDGTYRRMRGNSSCAAGTGSFLDQQAFRLGLSGGSAELTALALSNKGEYPPIASRCSVFAKTDLIHAQAEGWTIGSICEGLCHGLARNIADTLFPGEKPQPPLFMAGGVSRNAAVLAHLSDIAGAPLATDEYSHLYGAIGACLSLIEKKSWANEPMKILDLRIEETQDRAYANAPLSTDTGGADSQNEQFEYPDFSSLKRYLFTARKNNPENPVEVDIYLEPESLSNGDDHSVPVLLGFDIGSTSTKAAILTMEGKTIAGLYTRTAGRPLEAMQSICEATSAIERDYGIRFEVALAATTGSGRAFIGSVIGADAAVDEITAHARAAFELDPKVDTILEIGGQDSKFTALRDGLVTFSQMNTVCAAGTGSFLEEQAERLGVPLTEFSDRAADAKSPLTSDRCTVFMERDLNHLRGLGYATGELLAASLFSVCDNYLGKVARRDYIGARIAFQGATAKNKSLVAAFGRRLGKPLLVSKFCHLTGAIGAVLQARDERLQACTADARTAPQRSTFRGFGIHEQEIVSRAERCPLCQNECRLRVVEVGGENVAFGFQCGRDYTTKHFVRETGDGEILRERLRLISSAYDIARNGTGARRGYPVIGIPTTLYLADDARFWEAFFRRLGFPTLLAPDDAETLRLGKRLAGAEFCAPMAMFHGQAHYLLEHADFAFLPIYLAEKSAHPCGPDANDEGRRCYCNYSQYATVVVRCVETKDKTRIISPLLSGRNGDISKSMLEMRKSLAAALAPWGIRPPPMQACDEAYKSCILARASAKEKVYSLFRERLSSPNGDISVVLIGRPYAALSASMGAPIAELIAKRGVTLAYADMLPNGIPRAIDPLLAAFHWRYAAEVLESADFCARNPGFYPVFITTFKCSPDSFALEWFRRILEAAGKPYLVLQIDEHDSTVGYETRIEAGLRSFRNHFRRAKASIGVEGLGTAIKTPLIPKIGGDLQNKTVLFPNWDPLVCALLVANLRNSGIDARLLVEDPEAIRRAMSANSGQCIPISIIAGACIDYVEKERLDPSRVVLWMTAGKWPCNIPLFPHFIMSLLERHGGGMEKIEVYSGDIIFLYVGPKAMIGAYHAFMAGGSLRRLACRTRPYELEPGATDRLVQKSLALLIDAFETGKSKENAYREAFEPFKAIPTSPRNRPKVAIFGDFYARDNDTLNQGLEKSIEAAGGEVITMPYVDYLKTTLDPYFNRLLMDRNYGDWVMSKAAVAVVSAIEKSLSLHDHYDLDSPRTWRNPEFLEKIERFGIRSQHEGECFDNALKIFRILDEEPDTAFFVQTNPAFCCPSLVTEAMTREIEQVTGVMIVTITYDGTGAGKNDAVVPYLAFLRK